MIKNVQDFFDLREKNTDFFRDYSFCYLKLNAKQTPKKML